MMKEFLRSSDLFIYFFNLTEDTSYAVGLKT